MLGGHHHDLRLVALPISGDCVYCLVRFGFSSADVKGVVASSLSVVAIARDAC